MPRRSARSRGLPGAPAALGPRGLAASRRGAAAGRSAKRRRASSGMPLRVPCGVVVAITPVQLPDAARPPQGRAGARRRQRRDPEAGGHDAARRAQAHRAAARGRPAPARAAMHHRRRGGRRAPALLRPARAQDHVHRLDRRRRGASRTSPASSGSRSSSAATPRWSLLADADVDAKRRRRSRSPATRTRGRSASRRSA